MIKEMIDIIFSACVVFLQDLAKLTRMTYTQINVLIFCVLWPLFTLGLLITVIKKRKKIRELESLVSKLNAARQK